LLVAEHGTLAAEAPTRTRAGPGVNPKEIPMKLTHIFLALALVIPATASMVRAEDKPAAAAPAADAPAEGGKKKAKSEKGKKAEAAPAAGAEAAPAPKAEEKK